MYVFALRPTGLWNNKYDLPSKLLSFLFLFCFYELESNAEREVTHGSKLSGRKFCYFWRQQHLADTGTFLVLIKKDIATYMQKKVIHFSRSSH